MRFLHLQTFLEESSWHTKAQRLLAFVRRIANSVRWRHPSYIKAIGKKLNVQQWVTDKMQKLDGVSSKLLLPSEER
jgi:hypothetical protein